MAEYKKTTRGKNKKEYYYVTLKLGEKINSNGKVVRIRRAVYGRTIKELNDKIAKIQEKYKSGLPEKEPYFNILSEKYIRTFFMYDSELADTTKAMYLNAWERFVKTSDFYYNKLNQITSATIQQFYNDLHASGVKTSTIKKLHNLMGKFYRYIDVQGYGRNIVVSVKVPKDNRIIKSSSDVVIWTDEELEKIVKGIETQNNRFRWGFLIILLKNTGLRIGEALAVSINDIDEDGLHVRRQVNENAVYNDNKYEYKVKIRNVKSNCSRRIIPLNEEVRKELEKHLVWQMQDALKYGYRAKLEDGRLFTTNTGEYYSPRSVAKALRKFYERIGVTPKGAHTYRHTFGTLLCKRGVGIEVCSQLMGHESIQTTAKYYIGVSKDQKQDAVNVLLQTSEK